MRIDRVRLFIAGLTALFAALPPSHAAADCKPELLTATSVIFTKNRQIQIPVTVNGSPLILKLSTKGITELHEDVARKIGLQLHNTNSKGYGVGGAAIWSKAPVDDMRVGDLRIERQLYQYDYILVAEGDWASENNDGVLGSDVLTKYNVEIDLAAGLLKFFKKQSCGKPLDWHAASFSAPFDLSRDNQIEIKVLISGKNIPGLLNIGSESLYMDWSVASRLGIDKASPGLVTIGERSIPPHGRSLTVYAYRFGDVEFGNLIIKNPPIYITEMQIKKDMPTGSHIIDTDTRSNFTLGVDVATSNRIFIDYADEKIYFAPYDEKRLEAVRSNMKQFSG